MHSILPKNEIILLPPEKKYFGGKKLVGSHAMHVLHYLDRFIIHAHTYKRNEVALEQYSFSA